MSGVDALSSMFPGRDRHTLQTALDAHGGSVESTVEYLLSGGGGGGGGGFGGGARPGNVPGDGPGVPSIVYDSGNPIADRARARQLEQDEIMARTLALEEEREASQSPLGVARGFANSVADNTPAIPSMSSVGALVAPVISGLQYAGKVAVDTVSGIYDELVHATGSAGSSSTEPHSPDMAAAARRRAAERDASGDSTQVLRGDASSPTRSGLQARPRRMAQTAAGGSSAEKKRE